MCAKKSIINSLFPSCCMPQFQSESWRTTIRMEMSRALSSYGKSNSFSLQLLSTKTHGLFNVMLRFLKLIPRDTFVKLYNNLPHFNYCPTVWHFCGAHNTDKVGALNKRILRFILWHYFPPNDSLLTKVNSTSLCKKGL